MSASKAILLVNLALQILLALLQHVQLRAQPQDGILGAVLALLLGGAAEPAPHLDRCIQTFTALQKGRNRIKKIGRPWRLIVYRSL